jgi:hypothetical protein
VRAAADWGMVDVIIESDASNLIKAMQSTDFDKTVEGVIYRDLRLYCVGACHLKNYSFFFEPGKTVRQEPHSTLLPKHPHQSTSIYREKRERPTCTD